MRVDCTYFQPGEKARGKRFTTTWERLCARLLASPEVTSAKGDAAGISLATYRGDHRTLANVERVCAVGLDLDHNVPPWDDLLHAFSSSLALIYTTWSSTPDALRARVILPLDRPVSADEGKRVYKAVAAKVEGWGLEVDRAASDPSRFWYLPSVPRSIEALNGEREKKKLPPVSELPRFLAATRGAESDGPVRPVGVEWALLTVPAETYAPTAPPAPRSAGGEDRVVERAARWLAHRDPAIEGSGGDKHTFETVQSIVRGFDLDDGAAYRVLCDWNATCRPPWSEHGLRRKIREARERGRMPFGALRDARRSA